MEKNENGYSDFNFSNRSRLNCRGEYRDDVESEARDRDNTEKCNNCGKSLAMVYSPYQCFRMMYAPMDALCHGTLFEELYKPLMEEGTRG